MRRTPRRSTWMCYRAAHGDVQPHTRASKLAHGYVKSIYDPCAFLLFTGDFFEGFVIVEIDDLLNAGYAAHKTPTEELQKKFTFGKVGLVDERGQRLWRATRLPGLQLRGDGGHGEVHQRAAPLRPHREEPDKRTTLRLCQTTTSRSLVSLGWLSKELRMDLAGAHSLLSGTLPHPKVSDLLELNHAVAVVRVTANITLRYHPISLERLLFGVTSDGAISLITYKSHRAKRVCNSFLLVGTHALSEGLAQLEWVKRMFLSSVHRKYQASPPLAGVPALVEHRHGGAPLLRDALIIVDAKSLCDHLTRESAGCTMHKRVATEMAIFREHLDALSDRIRWVPHHRMLVDGLTKIRSNSAILLSALARGKYQLVAEREELARRSQVRESGLRIDRPRRSGASTSQATTARS